MSKLKQLLKRIKNQKKRYSISVGNTLYYCNFYHNEDTFIQVEIKNISCSIREGNCYVSFEAIDKADNIYIFECDDFGVVLFTEQQKNELQLGKILY